MTVELSAQRVEAIALFFYLATLDEHATNVASLRATRLVQRQIKSSRMTRPLDVLIVEICHKILKKVHKIRPPTLGNEGSVSNVEIPKTFDLGPWTQFHKNSSPEERIAIIFSCILRFPKKYISEGLNVSEGTVQYRVGSGLRQLGPLTTTGNYYG